MNPEKPGSLRIFGAAGFFASGSLALWGKRWYPKKKTKNDSENKIGNIQRHTGGLE